MLTISNLRLGFANNSSSSHSMVFLENPDEVKDMYGETVSFEWQDFILKSPNAKDRYLLAQIFQSLPKSLRADPFAAACILSGLMGLPVAEVQQLLSNSGEVGVDHQSAWMIAVNLFSSTPDPAFVADLQSYMRKEEVAIFGGNDNDSYDDERFHYPLSRPSPIQRLINSESDGWIARKDGDWWVVFNRQNGTKVRLSFNPNPNPVEYVKAIAPELVDLKITDLCHFNCPMCYQSSTKNGAHAEFSTLYGLAVCLGACGVFEVAIGGGEPTIHPEFVRILQCFRDEGVVPNFTTRNLVWMRDEEQRVPIMAACGSFAHSADNAAQVRRLLETTDKYGIPRHRFAIQVVMGTVQAWEFESLIQVCAENNVTVTLLGYKDVGRGKDVKPIPYEWWIESYLKVNKKTPCRLNIDTALASQCEEKLRLIAPSVVWHRHEGAFSMYIDAVAGKYGPSSYHEAELRGLPGRSNLDEVAASWLPRLFGTITPV